MHHKTLPIDISRIVLLWKTLGAPRVTRSCYCFVMVEVMLVVDDTQVRFLPLRPSQNKLKNEKGLRSDS
jgi:hypothetical protein